MGRIDAEVHIEQVRDGLQYKGHVKFGSDSRLHFTYEVDAKRNIAELERLSPEEANKEIDLYLTQGGARRVIPDDVQPLFRALVLPVAIEFYSNSMTRGHNSSETQGLQQSMAVFGASMSIGMTAKVASFDEVKIRPYLEKLLS